MGRVTRPPAKVSLRIGRVVLDGVSPAERALVTDGLQAGLTEAVEEWVRSGGADGAQSERRERLAPSTLGPADEGPADLGRSIAAAVAGIVFEPSPRTGG